MALLLSGAALTASAQSFEYLTFKKVNGDEFSMGIDHLKITFNDGILTATDGNKTQTVALNEMSKMFFSLTPTAIEQTAVATNEQIEATIVNGKLKVKAPAGSNVQVYSIDGRQMNAQHLTKGTYLVRINDKTLKVLAK